MYIMGVCTCRYITKKKKKIFSQIQWNKKTTHFYSNISIAPWGSHEANKYRPSRPVPYFSCVNVVN